MSSRYKSVRERVMRRRLQRRYFAGYVYASLTALATMLTIFFLGFVIYTILRASGDSLLRTQIAVTLAPGSELNKLGLSLCKDLIGQADLHATTRFQQGKLSNLLTPYAHQELCQQLERLPLQEVWLTAGHEVGKWYKNGQLPTDAANLGLLTALKDQGYIRQVFNWDFFKFSDSREAELAGILGSIIGSLYTLGIAMAIAFPLGVATAIYLEEFAPQNFLTRLIELNIRNLAAVPSIIFGVLGLTVFLGTMHLPRSSALVGGLTLALMAVPLMVTTTRTAFASIPRAVREAVIALGATRVQLVFDHLLPLAFPTIVTGTILSISRIVGETAPLLLIGMVAFLTVPPNTVLDPATVLPVQIYLWADSPEAGFVSNTSAAILVLIVFLLLINSIAIAVRKRYTTKMP